MDNQQERTKFCIEILKSGGEILYNELPKLFQKCTSKKDVSVEWKDAEVILLHKKGDQMDLKNIRPKNALPVIYKVFIKILERRMFSKLDLAQPK